MNYVIEVVDESEFSEGWLAFVLGQPRDETRSSWWLDGWDMADETPMLHSTRYVFKRQPELEHPQYRVTKP